MDNAKFKMAEEKETKPKCCQDKETLKKIKQGAEFLKVIAEDNRLKILYLLKNGEKCVCEIWQFLNLPQNLTSHHLKVLKDFGLLNSRKDGLKIYYSLSEKNLKTYREQLNKYLS